MCGGLAVFEDMGREVVVEDERSEWLRLAVAGVKVPEVLCTGEGSALRVMLSGGVKEMAVRTAYKRKADKVRPMDVPHKDGLMPEGDPRWREKRLA